LASLDLKANYEKVCKNADGKFTQRNADGTTKIMDKYGLTQTLPICIYMKSIIYIKQVR